MKATFLFVIFFVCHLIYQYYNMYVAKNSASLTLFSKQYSSTWSFLLMSVILFTPLLTIANLGFGFGFQFGYKILNNIWLVTIVFISAQLLSTMLSAVFIMGQSLEKGPVAGFMISIIGLVVANLWK
jgi:hypothetical protein